MAHTEIPHPEHSPHKTVRALAMSCNAVHKYKYALAFWMLSILILTMTFMIPHAQAASATPEVNPDHLITAGSMALAVASVLGVLLARIDRK
jgi:hypothetical protein